MTIQTTKVIEILEGRGNLRTTEYHQNDQMSSLDFSANHNPYPRDRYGRPTIDPLMVDAKFTEAATGEASTANFPDLLRLGIQYDLLSGFNATPTVYDRIVRMRPSNKQQEEYQDDSGIGLPPVVLEGQPYPESTISVGGGKIIKNFKRGMIIPVTEELQRFDQTGKVRETAELLGRAHALGREQSVMNVITNTSNYNVLNNNDQAGNNQQTLTFSPVNVNTAIALMMTQKDLQSGQYLGVMPTTLVIGPLLERFARALFNSTEINRQGGPTTAEVYGQGTNNPFFGLLTQIVVSPMFGASYQWCILDPSRAVYFQEVEGLSVQVEGATMGSESWLRRDVIRYKSRDWYGVDMRDDRFAFYSPSTAAPAAA